MRNDVQQGGGGSAMPRHGNGFFSLRSLSNYMRIVSSGAASVASTVRTAGASVASTIADRHDDASRDQVHWAGFDKLECDGNALRQILLLGYRSGFQVWDVEQADDVRQLVSRHDGLVSFLQMLKKPIASKKSEDRFGDVRPLLVVAGDASLTGSRNNPDGFASPYNRNGDGLEPGCEDVLPMFVRFYSLRTHDYVHVLKFRSAVFSIRCSPRVVAISQAAQIHCFNAATLEREYTILTYPIVSVCPGAGGIGCGPLAVGDRWLAYSGSPVAVSSTGRVNPQHVSPATVMSAFPSNGSLVAHYAKESSKQLAAGLVTLGDIGYKKLSKYYADYLADGNGSVRNGNSNFKTDGAIHWHLPDADNVGMVIVRDIVSKSVVVQFRAHTSPISALCFDPSGTLLVTASIHGHNINVFRIMPSPPGSSSGSDASGLCIHLYRLQRGITNAVIQDISFSDDSQWIMISSSRGTSHLFAISPSGGTASLQFSENNFANTTYGSDLTTKTAVSSHCPCSLNLHQQSAFATGPPVTLSVVSRIKNGSYGLKGVVTGAAAAAAGKVSPLSGAIASAFHRCKSSGLYPDTSSLRKKYYLLVFSPTGSIIQYVLRHPSGEDPGFDLSGLGTVSFGSSLESDARLVVEALQKWDICHKRNRRDRADNVDIYGDHGNGESTKVFQKGIKKGTSIYPANSATETRVKLNVEESHHLYISEAELQMHAPRIPLWAKSEICFQVMLHEHIKADSSGTSGGEIEIERFPTRTIEARSRNLIPVFDYLQTPGFQQAKFGPLLHQKSGASEDGRLSRRSSCSSVDCMSEIAAVAELPYGMDENSWSRSMTEANEDLVNNHVDSPNRKSQLEFVNNSEGLKVEARLECVNNKENLKMDTHFEGSNNDID